MPSNKGKRKKAPGGHAGADEKRWKAASLDMEILKEFESSGGLMIEEATDDVFVTYGIDGITTSASKGKSGKQRPLPDEEDDRAEAKRRKKKLKARAKAREKAQA